MISRLIRPIILLVALMTSTGLAHEPMTISCTAPARPVDDQDDALWQQFLSEIQNFQDCVTAAVDRHQAAAAEHQAAAGEAVDAWNRFVRTSLNAPEDFPWPPEDR